MSGLPGCICNITKSIKEIGFVRGRDCQAASVRYDCPLKHEILGVPGCICKVQKSFKNLNLGRARLHL